MPLQSKMSDRDIMHAAEVADRCREAFDTQHPHFFMKPKVDKTQPTTGWDPCAARVFAPMSWKRNEHKDDPVWTLQGCRRDGVYVDRLLSPTIYLCEGNFSQQKDIAIIEFPRVLIYQHANLSDALFHHIARCQASHAECLQLNILKCEIRRAETELNLELKSEDDNFDKEDTVYVEMESRASSFFTMLRATDGGSDTESPVESPSDTDELEIKRETPQYLKDIKEDEWDQFIGGILNLK
ncbi:hypothetical protein DFH06DRAFT_1123146 [Mycena polygramma]|nr:hypothetical protein DFH06DRAFT_1123146 [Mycena polygramma]